MGLFNRGTRSNDDRWGAREAAPVNDEGPGSGGGPPEPPEPVVEEPALEEPVEARPNAQEAV